MVKDSIKELRKTKKLTQKEFAELINVTQSTVSKWEKGETEPSFSELNLIYKIYGKNLVDGSMAKIELEKEWIQIKFYEDVKASAGCGIDNHCDNFELLTVDRKLLNPRVDPAKHHGIRVVGDSMEPTFKDGDVIFIEAYTGDFANNRVYIIKRQDDVFIKRLKKSGELFEIISDNPDYESYKLEHEKIQIIGRVV